IHLKYTYPAILVEYVYLFGSYHSFLINFPWGGIINADCFFSMAVHLRLIFSEDRKKLDSCGLQRVKILCYMDFTQISTSEVLVNTSEQLSNTSEQLSNTSEKLNNT